MLFLKGYPFFLDLVNCAYFTLQQFILGNNIKKPYKLPADCNIVSKCSKGNKLALKLLKCIKKETFIFYFFYIPIILKFF